MKRAISFLLQINGFPIQLYSCNNCIMRKYFLMAYFILSVCLCVSVCVCETDRKLLWTCTHACMCEIFCWWHLPKPASNAKYFNY